jgi:hypothetical protein
LLVSGSFFLIITLLILLCFVITVDIAGAREVYIILKNDSQKLRCTLDILSQNVKTTTQDVGKKYKVCLME